MIDDEVIRQLDESGTFIGRVVGRSYRTMLAAAIGEGMPENLAQQVIGPFLVKQMLGVFDSIGTASSDPEIEFLRWLQKQLDDPE